MEKQYGKIGYTCVLIPFETLTSDSQPHISLVTFCILYLIYYPFIGKHYGVSVDWWSFGVLCYEMLIGQSPFQGEDEDELFHSICNDSIDYPRWLSKDAINLVDKLLQRDPEKRIGCTEQLEPLRRHGFFDSIDWNLLESLKMQPPFKPKVRSLNDVGNFDADFTIEPPRLTPSDDRIIQEMIQSDFKGFSFTNPNFNC